MLFDSIFMFRIDEEECIIPTTVLTMHCIIHGPHKANCTSTCVCVNYSSQVKSYGWKSSLSCLQLSSSSSLLCLHSFQSARVGMFSTASLARTSLRTHTKPPHRYSVTLTLFSHSAILTSHQVFFPKISWLTFWKQQFVIFRSVHIYVNKTH